MHFIVTILSVFLPFNTSRDGAHKPLSAVIALAKSILANGFNPLRAIEVEKLTSLPAGAKSVFAVLYDMVSNDGKEDTHKYALEYVGTVDGEEKTIKKVLDRAALLERLEQLALNADSDEGTYYAVGAGNGRSLAIAWIEAFDAGEGIDLAAVETTDREFSNRREAQENKFVTQVNKEQQAADDIRVCESNPDIDSARKFQKATPCSSYGQAQTRYARAKVVAEGLVTREDAARLDKGTCNKVLHAKPDEVAAVVEEALSKLESKAPSPLSAGKVKTAAERCNDLLAPILSAIVAGDLKGLEQWTRLSNEDAAQAIADRAVALAEKAQASGE